MLKIRMQRTGRANMPSFRIVVTEHTEGPKSGKFVEKLGTYNPKTKERTLDTERVKYWLSVGAKASGTVHNMLVSAGIVSAKKVNVLPRKSPPAASDAVPEGQVAASDAAPAEEPKAEAQEPAEGEAPASAEPAEKAAAST